MHFYAHRHTLVHQDKTWMEDGLAVISLQCYVTVTLNGMLNWHWITVLGQLGASCTYAHGCGIRVAHMWHFCANGQIGMHCLQHVYCMHPLFNIGLTLDLGSMFPSRSWYALHIPASDRHHWYAACSWLTDTSGLVLYWPVPWFVWYMYWWELMWRLMCL